MRKKRNKFNTTFPSDGYIKKYFGTEISRILVPSNRNLQNCEIPYVSHPEAEGILYDCLIGDPLMDRSLVFTGLTGSGKTTILRHVFGLERKPNTPHFMNSTIVIPVDFNRSHYTAQDAILCNLRAAVDTICEKYKIKSPNLQNEEFYQFVKELRNDLLKFNIEHNELTPHAEILSAFHEKMPHTFASCQLQYVMEQEACELQLVVFIVDNIEGFIDKNAEKKIRFLLPVIEALRLAECIEQRKNPTKWCFNMVIVCRHHIWRLMKGFFSDNSRGSALLQSFDTTEPPYDLAKPVNMNDIVEKREIVFSRRQRNQQKWDTAVKVVNTIMHTMENSIGDFVMQLELKDLRKSMSKMQELILHRGLQKKTDEEIIAGAFQIDSVEQFDLTRVNLIRIIGLGNWNYYSDINSIIPNLLYNEQHEGIELYPLLTLKYFLIQCGYAEPAWDNPVSISEFYSRMKSVFGFSNNEFKKKIERSVHFLLQHRLLLRSADQPQNEVPGLSLEEIYEIENVYVSGAAVRLWKELGKSSALFQLFLDDIWLDENLDYFEENGNDIEHCIMYLNELCQIERRIYNTAKNLSIKSEEDYIVYFGVTPICKQLVNGLITSLETISTSSDVRSQNRIKVAQETLMQARELSRKMTEWEQIRKSVIS